MHTQIETYREETPGVLDQDLKNFVIVDDEGKPVGTVEDNDSVIFFNFRGDRALEISRSFDEKDFLKTRSSTHEKAADYIKNLVAKTIEGENIDAD